VKNQALDYFSKGMVAKHNLLCYKCITNNKKIHAVMELIIERS